MYPYRITTIGQLGEFSMPAIPTPSSIATAVRADVPSFAVVGLIALLAGVAIGRATKR